METKLIDPVIEQIASNYISLYKDELNALNQTLPGIGSAIEVVVKNAFIEGLKTGLRVNQRNIRRRI